MDKETIKNYLEEIILLMNEGKFILAHRKLMFVFTNIGGKKIDR